MINTDLITGLIVLGISGLSFIQSRSFTFHGRVFIDWTLILLTGLGLILILKSVFKCERVKFWVENAHGRQVFLLILALIANVSLIPLTGFIVASILGFLLISILLTPTDLRRESKSWFKAFGVGILITMIFYVLFKIILMVPLPGGILGIG